MPLHLVLCFSFVTDGHKLHFYYGPRPFAIITITKLQLELYTGYCGGVKSEAFAATTGKGQSRREDPGENLHP